MIKDLTKLEDGYLLFITKALFESMTIKSKGDGKDKKEFAKEFMRFMDECRRRKLVEDI